MRPPSSKGLWPGADRLGGPTQGLHEPAGVGVDAGQGRFDQRQEIGPHPHARELHAVGDFVQGQPQAELPGREGEALLQRQDVRADVVDDVLILGDAHPR